MKFNVLFSFVTSEQKPETVYHKKTVYQIIILQFSLEAQVLYYDKYTALSPSHTEFELPVTCLLRYLSVFFQL